MSRVALAIALLLSMTAGTLSADEAVELKYKMTKEDKLQYRAEVTMSQSQTIGGMDVGFEMKNEGFSLRTLDKFDEKGNLRIKSEEKRLKVHMKVGPAIEYNFDSTKEKQEEGSMLSSSLNPLYEKLKNAVSYTTLTPRGQVQSVEGLTELVEETIKNDPIARQFAGGLSEKAQKLSAAELYPEFSEKPVKPGDTWESKYELDIPQLGKANGKRVYTYEAADTVGDTKTARIRLTHELAFDLDLEQNGAKVKGNLQIQQSSGVIQFDVEKGHLVSMDATYVIGGDLTVDVNGKLLPVKQSQTQTLKLELVKDEAK